MTRLAMLIGILVAAADSEAATWRVAPGDPWPQIAGGDEVVLLPGVHLGPLTLKNAAAGSPDRPTIIRSEVRHAAVVIGCRGVGDGVQVGTESQYPDGCHWVVVEGLRIQHCKRDGIRGYGSNCVVRDCWISHCGIREAAPGEGQIRYPVGQGVAWFGNQRDVRFEGNLVEYNGSSAWDHGFYCYGRDHEYVGNTVRWNAGAGLNLYSVTAGFRVDRNLCYGNCTYGVYAVVAPGESLAVADNVLIANGRYGLAVIGTAAENVALSGNLIVSNALGVAAGGDGFDAKVVTSMPASQPAEE